jgi:hypothetical protein
VHRRNRLTPGGGDDAVVEQRADFGTGEPELVGEDLLGVLAEQRGRYGIATASSKSINTASAPDATALANRSGRSPGTYKYDRLRTASNAGDATSPPWARFSCRSTARAHGEGW